MHSLRTKRRHITAKVKEHVCVASMPAMPINKPSTDITISSNVQPFEYKSTLELDAKSYKHDEFCTTNVATLNVAAVSDTSCSSSSECEDEFQTDFFDIKSNLAA